MPRERTHDELRRNGTVASRLATVETRVEALLQSVESLTRSVESLTRQVGTVGKMSWPLLVAGLGVLATWTGVVGVIGHMAIEPVRVEIHSLRKINECRQSHLKEVLELKSQLSVYESRRGPRP